MDYRNTVSMITTLPIYISDWWEIQNNFIVNWQELQFEYNEMQTNFDQWFFTINTTQTFNLLKNFTIELSAFYNSPHFFWGIDKVEAYGMVNIGIQKKFEKNNTTLRLTVDDIFKIGNWSSSVSIPEQGIETQSYFELSYPVVRLTFSQQFGNNKLKSKRECATGSEEERSRVN